jgi:hypothetical protein
MKRSALGTAAIVMTIAAPLCGASAWADEAHHPAQAAPAQTQAAPSAHEQMQPGHAPGSTMMNCSMMHGGQTVEGGIMGCPMMQGHSGMMPGQTQGMGPGTMQGQTQHGPPIEQGQMQPGQMQPPANRN